MAVTPEPLYGFSLRSTWLKDHGGRELVVELGKTGFNYLEIMPDSALDAGFGLDEIVEIIQENGMSAGFHSPYAGSDLLRKVEGAQVRKVQGIIQPIIDASIQAAKNQKDPVVINLHGASGPKDPSRRNEYYFKTWELLRWVDTMVRLSREDLLTTIELLPYAWNRTRVGDRYHELVRLVQAIDSPRLGICWDMGHGWVTQQRQHANQAPNYDYLVRVCHTHIHEIDPEGRDHAPLVYGLTPLDEYISLLKGVNYRGVWLLEIDPNQVTRLGKPLPIITGSLNRLKSLVET